MSIDDQVNIVELFPDHFPLNIYFIFAVNQSDLEASERNDLLRGELQMDLGTIHVACDCLDWSNGLKFVENGHINDIPRVENKINVLKEIEDRRMEATAQRSAHGYLKLHQLS